MNTDEHGSESFWHLCLSVFIRGFPDVYRFTAPSLIALLTSPWTLPIMSIGNL